MSLKHMAVALEMARELPAMAEETYGEESPPVGLGIMAHVLLVLADYADQNTGIAWPSIERIAEDTIRDARTVRRALRSLEKLGLVENLGGADRRNPPKYRVLPDYVLERPAVAGAQRSGEKVFKARIRRDLFTAQEGRCNGCGEAFALGEFHVDHVVPLKRGGTHAVANLQLLCAPCNLMKGARSHDYLLDMLERAAEDGQPPSSARVGAYHDYRDGQAEGGPAIPDEPDDDPDRGGSSPGHNPPGGASDPIREGEAPADPTPEIRSGAGAEAESVRDQTPPGSPPLTLVDTSGDGGDEEEDPDDELTVRAVEQHDEEAVAAERYLARSIGVLTPPDGWGARWLERVTLGQVREACDEARARGARSYRYVDAILEGDAERNEQALQEQERRGPQVVRVKVARDG